MNDSLYIAATGMQAQQLNVDTIANNLANVNTPAFKRGRVGFEDLLYREVVRSGPLLGAEPASRFGSGVAVSGTAKSFVDGDLKKTDGPLDVALRGAGFFEVALPDGSRAFTRNGALQVNREGALVTSEGHAILPALQIPPEATAIAIDSTGNVSATVPGEAQPVAVGQLELARFVNPAGLSALGANLYLATEKSGDAITGKPGEEGFGTLSQGFLESSNVKLVDELVALVLAQRAFEVNARAVQAADELLSLVNNLRRA
jgi:flagellar basal-body rod protein FlgG